MPTDPTPVDPTPLEQTIDRFREMKREGMTVEDMLRVAAGLEKEGILPPGTGEQALKAISTGLGLLDKATRILNILNGKE